MKIWEFFQVCNEIFTFSLARFLITAVRFTWMQFEGFSVDWFITLKVKKNISSPHEPCGLRQKMGTFFGSDFHIFRNCKLWIFSLFTFSMQNYAGIFIRRLILKVAFWVLMEKWPTMVEKKRIPSLKLFFLSYIFWRQNFLFLNFLKTEKPEEKIRMKCVHSERFPELIWKSDRCLFLKKDRQDENYMRLALTKVKASKNVQAFNCWHRSTVFAISHAKLVKNENVFVTSKEPYVFVQ